MPPPPRTAPRPGRDASDVDALPRAGRPARSPRAAESEAGWARARTRPSPSVLRRSRDPSRRRPQPRRPRRLGRDSPRRRPRPPTLFPLPLTLRSGSARSRRCGAGEPGNPPQGFGAWEQGLPRPHSRRAGTVGARRPTPDSDAEGKVQTRSRSTGSWDGNQKEDKGDSLPMCESSLKCRPPVDSVG